MNNKILIYHANCPDGFGAAWAFWRKFGDDIDFMTAYQDGYDKKSVLNSIRGKEVYMADLCFDDRDFMIEISRAAKSFVVLDHHKTSKDKCEDLDFCTFRMDRSGAVMAWEYLFPEEDVPPILAHIQDRDIFIWELIGSKEILTRLDTLEYNFEVWDRFNSRLGSNNGLNEIVHEGEAQLVYLDYLVAEHIKHKHYLNIAGYIVPATNAGTRGLQHESATEMSIGQPFAASYRHTGDKYTVSLRSDGEEGVDVAKIAESFGGGGHFHAAAFMIDNLEGFIISEDEAIEHETIERSSIS